MRIAQVWIAVLSCFPLAASGAFGQVTQAWVAHYDGTGGTDRAQALTVDGAGNLYVTGYSVDWAQDDCACVTIKYTPSGHPAWVGRHYSAPGSKDEGWAIAVDGAGNVHVTGRSFVDFSTDWDYLTIKYDSLGNELWATRYDGPRHLYEDAYAIGVDPLGNVVVTGRSYGNIGPAGSFDYATIKYDPAGNQLWAARYGTEGDEWAEDLVIDSSGNTCVTGRGDDPGVGSSDYVTLKYDSAGQQLWLARYDGPDTSQYAIDDATDLVRDRAGNLYVTGESEGENHYADVATVKYDSSGIELWVARYDGPDHWEDGAHRLAVDPWGNILAGGYTYATSDDFLTLKYESSGQLLWANRYDTPARGCDWIEDVGVDSFGNAYVTGPGGAPEHDYVTVKYGANGSFVWVAQYDGPVHSWDQSFALVVDPAGHVAVTGWAYWTKTARDVGNTDYVTVKYIPSVELFFANAPATVHRGQRASWRYQLASTADTTQTFQWWLAITGPMSRDVYLGQKTLAAHQKENGTIRLRVPRGAPVGEYRVVGTVGVWTTRAPWDQTAFECQVTGQSEKQVEAEVKVEDTQWEATVE